MDVTDPHVIGAELIASDSSLSRDIDRPGYQLALADETITLQFETSERVETAVFPDDQRPVDDHGQLTVRRHDGRCGKR